MSLRHNTSFATTLHLRLTAHAVSNASIDNDWGRRERIDGGMIDLAGGTLSRRKRPATGAMLVPRRGLSQLIAGAGTARPSCLPIDRELQAALGDALAWRRAWRALQYHDVEGWASPLKELARLERRVTGRLPSWQEATRSRAPMDVAQRDGYLTQQDLLWAARDGQLLLAWASARGPATPLQLAQHFGLDADAASAAPGATVLTAQERMALSLYSVNSQVRMMQVRALDRAFHVINAALRHQHPQMQWALQGMIGPLLSGLRRLSAVTEPVMRGLWLPGPDALAALRDRLQPGARFITTDLWTGSRQAAYPGHVVFRIQPLPNASATQARDTSVFSYAGEQREATFVPGTHLEVLSVQFFEPHAKQDSNLDLSDALTASSGRSWSALDRQPLLKVKLRELPAAPCSKVLPGVVQSMSCLRNTE